jgi:hypothetical protein
LAELVYAFLENNGEVPVLAADEFFAAPRRPGEDVEVAFELDVFSPDGAKSEIDIAVRQGPNLWLGEATTKDFFERAARKERERLERLSAVVELLAARGVLMASSTTFRAATTTRIRTVFSGSWPSLHIEERVRTLPAELLQIQLELPLTPKP